MGPLSRNFTASNFTLAVPHLSHPEHWLVGVSQGQAPGHGKLPERD